MKALIPTSNKRTERVFLIGAELKSRTSWEVREALDELAELAVTAGAEVVGDGTQRLETPAAGTFIGRGKADEFARSSEAAWAEVLGFIRSRTAQVARR